MPHTEVWTVAEEVLEGSRHTGLLNAADPLSRHSFGSGIRPVKGGVAEVSEDFPLLRIRLGIRAVIDLVLFPEARRVGFLDIDPIRRHNFVLVNDFFSRMAH